MPEISVPVNLTTMEVSLSGAAVVSAEVTGICAVVIAYPSSSKLLLEKSLPCSSLPTALSEFAEYPAPLLLRVPPCRSPPCSLSQLSPKTAPVRTAAVPAIPAITLKTLCPFAGVVCTSYACALNDLILSLFSFILFALSSTLFTTVSSLGQECASRISEKAFLKTIL